MNIKDTEISKKDKLKGIKRQLYIWYPIAFLCILTLLYSIFFRMNIGFFSKLIISFLVLATLTHYLYNTVLFIKFIRAENVNDTNKENKD
jgi:hypothetical protein